MPASALVYLEKSEVGGQTKIAIEVQRIEEFIENRLIKIPIPVVSKTSQNESSAEIKYKDIKRMNYAFTIEGFIAEQTATVKGTSQLITAIQAKNALIYYVLFPYGDINFYWRGLPASGVNPGFALSALLDATDTDRKTTVAFEKVQFRDSPGTRKDFFYRLINGYDFNETGPKRYDFSLTLIKGVTFET